MPVEKSLSPTKNWASIFGYKYIIEARAGSYGFGRTWFLVMKKGAKKRSFFLGQGVKVMSRTMGVSAKDYGGDWYKAQKKVSKDYLLAVFENDLTKSRVDSLFNQANDWDLAVE